MAKRANGEGSIRKRKDNKWLVTFPTGLYKENGKREYIYRYANTQAEALEILHQLQVERAMDQGQSTVAIKTGDWIENWIETVKAPHLATATLASYRNNFRIHIKPYIGKIPIRKLTGSQIQGCLNKIGGSYSTFVKNFNIINGAMKKAVKRKKIIRNPCEDVEFPKNDKREMRVLTQEEQQKFIEVLEGEYYRPMLMMYLFSGLRLGEGIPLTWEDVDLENQTIRVNKKAISCHDYASHSAPQVVEKSCKTPSSTRTVLLSDIPTDVLKKHKQKMMDRAKELGEEWSESNLVFINSRGNMVYSRNLQRILYKIFDKAGIKGATMHTLRHTYATRCFEVGIDIKAISEQLGHADVGTTYDTYVHLLREMKVKEIKKLNKLDQFMPREEKSGSLK